MTNRKKLGFALSVIALTALVACAAPTPTPTPTPKVFKIGICASQTGWSAPWGVAVTVPVLMYVDKVNAEGGLLVNGERYKIETIIEDDKGEPTVARAGVEKLIFRDKVKFLFTTYESCVATFWELARDNKLIQMYTALTPEFFDSGNPYAFNILPSAEAMGEGFYDAIVKEHPEVKSAIFIAGRGQTGEMQSAGSSAAAKAHGLKWLGTEWYDYGTVDFMPIITRALAKKPDMIDISYGGEATFLKLARQLGYTGVVGASGTADVVKLMNDTSPELAEGFYMVEGTHYPTTPVMEEYMEEYTARAGEWFGYSSAQWYGIRLLLKAIQTAGTVDDTDKIREALEQTELVAEILPEKPTISWGGAVTYGHAHQFLTPHCVNTIRDGKPVTVGMIWVDVP